jgi:hypothetical protein
MYTCSVELSRVSGCIFRCVVADLQVNLFCPIRSTIVFLILEKLSISFTYIVGDWFVFVCLCDCGFVLIISVIVINCIGFIFR